MTKLIVLDTETTGMQEPVEVCECAFVVLNPDTLIEEGRFHSLIDPQRSIQPSASGIHTITNDMVGDSPTLDEWFYDVLGDPFRHENVVMAAHKADYDYPKVKKYFGKDSVPLCTLRLARQAWEAPEEVDDHKLSTLKYTFNLGEMGSRSHGALADVLDCADLLRGLAFKYQTNIDGLLDIAASPIIIKRWTFGKHKGQLLSETPKDYLRWVLRQPEGQFDADLIASIKEII